MFKIKRFTCISIIYANAPVYDMMLITRHLLVAFIVIYITARTDAKRSNNSTYHQVDGGSPSQNLQERNDKVSARKLHHHNNGLTVSKAASNSLLKNVSFFFIFNNYIKKENLKKIKTTVLLLAILSYILY